MTSAPTPSTPSTPFDLVDRLVPLAPGQSTWKIRHERPKVVEATQGSYEALFEPELSGSPLVERLLVAAAIARSAGSDALHAHYRARLDALAPLSPAQQAAADGAPVESLGAAPRLQAVLRFLQQAVAARIASPGDPAHD